MAMGQSNSFLASSNKLVWENVFITNDTNIQAFISRHSKLKITSADQNIIKGNAAGIRNTCPETSVFMKDNVSFNFEIESSDGKYRVTVTNIIFTKKNAKKGTIAENYFIKDGQILTTGTLPADLNCIDAYFNRIFNTTLYKNRQ
ncbi:hypothetical protein AM493_02840 [Flavobacterium akiainvivens]|uniref:DUF4468 domain-containing protein n=2 Tax=Flavobacterium akiainvivens TaxID=1202724 RepID=A0A0M8MGG8_9FLAO|nr:hypothetical protein AM493_02840 [Flavobacterium akiainvivens]SFQ51754.1 hypothetical protein SAMN05444144_106236 [Flavobacterium akiainvivens]